MKKSAIGLALLSLAAAPSAFAGFVNGGFEDGTLAGWEQGGGIWQGGEINVADYTSSGAAYNPGYITNTVVSQGIDAHTGGALNSVFSGNYSVRVNNDVNDYSVSLIKQTVKNYTDDYIYFAWAAVLQASHEEYDSDNFILRLTNDTTGETLYNVVFNSANAAGDGLFSNYGDWYFTQWQVQQLDVSKYYGDTFSLTLLGSDCPYGGHAGYVYLDGFGAAIPNEVPEPVSVSLMGLGLLGLAGLRRRR